MSAELANSSAVTRQSSGGDDATSHAGNNFDFMRCLCASFVIWYHTSCLMGRSVDPLFRLSSGSLDLGNLSVSTFFIISGFLITQSYQRTQSLVNFVTARFLRIWPAMFVLCVLTVFVLGPLTTELNLKDYFADNDTWKYFKNCFFTDVYYFLPGVFHDNQYKDAVNGSIWSLPVEVFMYTVTLAFGLLRVSTNKLMMSVIVAILVALDIKVFGTDAGGKTMLLWLPPMLITMKYAIMYMMGAMFYTFRQEIRLSWKVAACLLIVLAGSFGTPVCRTLQYLCIPYLVMFAAFLPVPFLRGFGKRADLSYGIYLYGFPVQQWTMHVTRGHISPTKFTLVTLAMSAILAALSWKLIEKPALNLKKVLRAKGT